MPGGEWKVAAETGRRLRAPMRVRMRPRRLAEAEASRAGDETAAEDETPRAEDEDGVVIGMSGVGAVNLPRSWSRPRTVSRPRPSERGMRPRRRRESLCGRPATPGPLGQTGQTRRRCGGEGKSETRFGDGT